MFAGCVVVWPVAVHLGQFVVDDAAAAAAVLADV